MNQEDLARALADRRNVEPNVARDQLDRLVHGIVKRLRQGRAAEMPGIGRIKTATRPSRPAPPKPGRSIP